MRSVFKGHDTIVIHFIAFKYTDLKLDIKNNATKVKDFYNKNCRRKIDFRVKCTDIEVPFGRSEFKEAIEYAKNKVSDGDVKVYVCNPNRSHTSGVNVYSHTGYPNLVHEIGHALGLGHSSVAINGRVSNSKDPFDIMTMYAPYPSLNPVNLAKFNWFLPEEIEEPEIDKEYTLNMLRNFTEKLAVLKLGNSYVSYASKGGIPFLAIHKNNRGKSVLYFNKSPELKTFELDSFNLEITYFDRKIIKLIIK